MRLDHVVFPVSDAAASLAFYGAILGLPLIAAHEGDDWGGHPWLMLLFGLDDGRQLVLVAFRGASPPAFAAFPAESRHVAFAEAEPQALAGWRARLAAAGVEAWEEDHGDQRSLYFADPDGLILEITAPPSASVPVPDPEALAIARRWIAAS